MSNGILRGAGAGGDWWSSRIATATNAYYLGLDVARAYSSNGPAVRYVGRSLRCLSTAVD